MLHVPLTAALCLFPLAASAQTQLELTMQAREEAERVQAQIDTLYARILERVDERAKQRLTMAQTAWSTYLDKQCLWEADWYRGGSASPYQYNVCWKRLAEARLAELKNPMNLQQLAE